MEIGTFNLCGQREASQLPSRVVGELREQVSLAEQAGFGAAWFAEHHFSNYSLTPSPLMMVAHCAAVTERIRLGSAILILPLYSPARLLGEIAMADAMSNGRLVLGVGSGYQNHEMQRFGVDLADTKDMTEEMLDIIESFYGAETVAYQGRFFQLPHTYLALRPTQAKPDIWVAGNSPQLHRRAATSGYGLMLGSKWSTVQEQLALKRSVTERWREAGGDADDMRYAILSYCHVTDSAADARAFVDNARFQMRLAAQLRHRKEVLVDGLLPEESVAGEPPLDTFLERLLVGNAEQVASRLIRFAEALRPSRLMLYFQMGNMPHTKVMASIERFASDVLPRVEQALGPIAHIGVRQVADAAD